jgi:flagellar P-ring protein precursor FlgI
MRKKCSAIFALLIAAGCVLPAAGVQVQDIVRIKGAETNKLIGMGLVLGLRGTGDGGKSATTMRRLAAMMNRLDDSSVTPFELKDVKNVAVVYVSAKLPGSGVREGDKVDIQIASAGPASSLEGGRLVLTPLVGPVPGSPVFAYAEGSLVLENANVPTVATVPGGATLTRDVMAQFMDQFGRMTLVLDQQNATWPMANTLAMLVNDVMAPDAPPIAFAMDQKNVVVQLPPREQRNPAPFIAQVLEIQLDPTLVRTEARVVVNQRTNTIVMTGDVQMSPVVISHPNLTITTMVPPQVPTPERPEVRQNGFVGIDPAQRGGVRLADLLAAFNQLKVPPADRIEIVKEIHRTGKLHAKLIIED